MHKKLIVSILALCLVNPLTVLASSKGGGTKFASTGATVSGFVELISRTTRNFPSDLEDIYLGRSESITVGKKGKKIPVEGSYEAGASVVRVEEDGDDFDSTDKKYSFDIPVPAKISSNSGVFVEENLPISLFFASQDELEENGFDEDGGNSSVAKLFKKKFLKTKHSKKPFAKLRKKIQKIAMQNYLNASSTSISNISAFMSVTKVIANRKGSSATVKGSFVRKSSPARGRFSLNFEFSED